MLLAPAVHASTLSGGGVLPTLSLLQEAAETALIAVHLREGTGYVQMSPGRWTGVRRRQ